jgi:transcription elongation factor GreA
MACLFYNYWKKIGDYMVEKERILTLEGKTKLEEELHFLENEKRAEIGERIKVAREFGDISENSEYDDAKNEQGMMEARIAEISRVLSESTVVNVPKRSTKVTVGSTVEVDMNKKKRTFTIVGGAESDAQSGRISNESPVGEALLGHKKGDVVEVTGPTGKQIVTTILKIEH